MLMTNCSHSQDSFVALAVYCLTAADSQSDTVLQRPFYRSVHTPVTTYNKHTTTTHCCKGLQLISIALSDYQAISPSLYTVYIPQP